MAAIRLPEALDRTAIEELVATIRETFDAGSPLLLDGGNVERIGQAGLQLLLSAARTAGEKGLMFGISDPSQALTDVMALTALDSTLNTRAQA